MGCAGSQEAASEVNTVRSDRLCASQELEVIYPPYWSQQADGDATMFRRCIDCTANSSAELNNLQRIVNATLCSIDDQCKSPRYMRVHRAVRLEDSVKWNLYDRSVAYISRLRSGNADMCGGESGSLVGEVRSPRGSLQQPPKTLEALPEPFLKRMRLDAQETYLWHGTDQQSAEQILSENFKLAMAGKVNAAVLGKGVYLAESASFADKYATADEDGLCPMLLVRAALGRTYVETRYTRWRGRKLVRTASTEKIVRKGQYDSVLGDRNKSHGVNIREYCVANSYQLYPEYLIFYSREREVVKVREEDDDDELIVSL
eukprot:TRINITY_DN27274_c0_g1_i1.p1 TRINITY_DN27274_c0_g1~~TRINITY_DN27274_c0_g1_i1.p1  ORF type:complete len:317 (-),score=30.86 TRINITY_DN27274_c0_g1_i1:188-1138(-)